MFPMSLWQWSGYCGIAGFTAALLMNIPMYVQPSGYQPAYIAAAGLIGADVGDISTGLAVSIHHVTGTVAALLYGLVVWLLSAALPTGLSLNGIPAVPHLAGVVAVILFIYQFFQRIAVPRVQPGFDTAPVVEQWALSSFIYGVTLALVLPVVVTQF